MCTRGGRTRSSLCWVLSLAMNNPPRLQRSPAGLIRVLYPQRLANVRSYGLVADYIIEPLLELHLAPPNRPLHQVSNRAVGLGSMEKLCDSFQLSKGIGTVDGLWAKCTAREDVSYAG